jgi:phosphate:Na+ symporter
MADKTMETLKASLDTFEKRNKSGLAIVDALESEVDLMKKALLNNHIDRLQEKTCDPQTGVTFTNMVATLERAADHATNIAFSIVND